MVKRKDTKLYQALVQKYCNARRSVELQKKNINEYYIKIGKAKTKFDMLSVAPIMDEDIKEWYEGYTSILRMTVSMAENNIKWDEEKMKQAAAILIADYEENLDTLYNNNKK